MLACALALTVLVPSAGAASYDADTVIVQYRDGASKTLTSALAERAGVLSKVSNIYGSSAQVLRVSGDPADVAAALNRSSLVNYAEVNKILRTTANPNDPQLRVDVRPRQDLRLRPAGTPRASAASRRPAARRSASSTPASSRRTRT